ncbi:MAG: nucleoside recognition domain-containing protein [bacterium]
MIANSRWGTLLKTIWKDSLEISFELFKLMIPVVIVVKILQELGAITILGDWLTPVMQLLGLPGYTGLVWATALFSNFYAAMLVYISLIGEADPLSIAQVTVLTSMMLIAHNLPVELRIVQKAGPRLWSMALLRVGVAIVYGYLLFVIQGALDWNQQTAQLVWEPSPVEPGLMNWALNEVQNLFWIFVILVALVALMKFLDETGLTGYLQSLLAPILRTLGIGREATNLTVIGVTLGLAYGGGLILREARSGLLSMKDVYFSLALMSICHSAIEDTLLMLLLGADWVGILVGRFLFGFLVIWLMVKMFGTWPDSKFKFWFWHQNN